MPAGPAIRQRGSLSRAALLANMPALALVRPDENVGAFDAHRVARQVVDLGHALELRVADGAVAHVDGASPRRGSPRGYNLRLVGLWGSVGRTPPAPGLSTVGSTDDA